MDFTLSHNETTEVEKKEPSRAITPEQKLPAPSPKMRSPLIQEDSLAATSQEPTSVIDNNKIILSQESPGISIDALLLAGLQQCSGSSSKKAQCFYMIV